MTTSIPQTNFHDPFNPLNQDGIIFFPGSVPLYKDVVGNGTKVLVGGLGVSGDGVDQDDDVTYSAPRSATGPPPTIAEGRPGLCPRRPVALPEVQPEPEDLTADGPSARFNWRNDWPIARPGTEERVEGKEQAGRMDPSRPVDEDPGAHGRCQIRGKIAACGLAALGIGHRFMGPAVADDRRARPQAREVDPGHAPHDPPGRLSPVRLADRDRVSYNEHYSGGFVGGGKALGGHEPCPQEGTWGWDYTPFRPDVRTGSSSSVVARSGTPRAVSAPMPPTGPSRSSTSPRTVHEHTRRQGVVGPNWVGPTSRENPHRFPRGSRYNRRRDDGAKGECGPNRGGQP